MTGRSSIGKRVEVDRNDDMHADERGSETEGEESVEQGHTPGRAGTGDGERGTQTDRSVRSRESDGSDGGTSQRLVRGDHGESDELDPDTTL